MCTIFMHIDIFNLLAVNISTYMISLINNKTFFSLFFHFISKNRTIKSTSNNQIIIHSYQYLSFYHPFSFPNTIINFSVHYFPSNFFFMLLHKFSHIIPGSSCCFLSISFSSLTLPNISKYTSSCISTTTTSAKAANNVSSQ